MNCSSQRRQRKPAVGPCPASWRRFGADATPRSWISRTGRHAPGLRQLRQAIGGLARRGDWAGACDGALALAGPLLRRGRTRAALAAIDEGRDYSRRAGSGSSLVDFAILSGEAWIDLARLDEAESVLGSALAAARSAGDGERSASASLALARCLFWRGLYADAAAVLGAAADHLRPAHTIRHRLLAARAATGLGDLTRAMTLVLEAREIASRAADSRGRAAVSSTSAFVHLVVGDLDAVERDAVESLAAAQAERDPLRALRVRLLQLESDRRRGRRAVAAASLQRLRRVMAAAPPVVRARWELSSSLASRDDDPGEIVARHVSATGLGALGLYGSASSPPSRSHDGADPFVDELVAILRVCQAAEDEAEVLQTSLRSRASAPAGGIGRLRQRSRPPGRAGARRWCPARHQPCRTRRGREHHDRAAPERGSRRGGGTRSLWRRHDWRAVRTLDARLDRRHVARRLRPDDERGGGGADACRGDRQAG